MQITQINLPKMLTPPRRKRVAAYARVSNGKEAMIHSLSAQISYYNSLIQKHSDWEFAGVYADEAISGTKDNRAEFKRLMEDCRAGKIDMIIVKSISRMARNTLTLLQTVRELREMKIDVFFERENLHSSGVAGELLLTVLASFAQEESLSNSNNKLWQVRRDFKKGKPTWFHTYGYKWIDHRLYIIPEEAAVIRFIYQCYYEGMGRVAIMKILMDLDIPPRDGGIWYESAIAYILENEKYRGDMLLQKFYREDHISKKRRKNKGQRPQYYVSNSHEPIIQPWLFDEVQRIRKRRREKYFNIQDYQYQLYPFSGKIRCGMCGANFRRKTTASGTKYSKHVWICSDLNQLGKFYCPSRYIPEDILMETTAQVLGIPEFDAEVFEDNIQRIVATDRNALLFVFRDGREVEAHWEHRSRRESWDEEARQKARDKYLENVKRRREHANQPAV